MLVKIRRPQSGFTLIEVLVTFLIIAIGLLGLGALQLNTMNNSFETYQRALVASIVEDMAARIRMNTQAAMAGEYFLAPPSDLNCGGYANTAESPAPPPSQYDLCEWHALIKGLSEATDGTSVDAPIGAVGCIDRLSGGGSKELWIRVSVAWIGITPQTQTPLDCGANEMGDEAYRRVVFRDVAVR